MSEKPKLLIDHDLAQSVLNYLTDHEIHGRSWNQVNPLIMGMARLQPAPAPQPEKTNGASAEPVAEVAPQN